VAERVLRITRLPTVIDADGLNIFAGRTADLATLLAKRPAIITPHPAEFGRLVGRSVQDVLANRFEIGAPLAAQLGATVLLKGVPTVLTDQEGRRLVSAAGSPVLAVGGSGDVLSGIVTTLLAQTRDPLGSAGAAAWVHGTAAEHAGMMRTRGVVLDDVLAALPTVWEAQSPAPRYPVLAELPAVGDPS
jgi:NAD(P)H-hydrate epimerase